MTAYNQTAKARGEEQLREVPEDLVPITSHWTARGKHAARDFKLVVGSALLKLVIAGGSRPSRDIITVKPRSKEFYCVLVTEAGAACILDEARSMTFGMLERARASKPRKGEEAKAVKHVLDEVNEMGLTNVLGIALPDTHSLTQEQTDAGACRVRGHP